MSSKPIVWHCIVAGSLIALWAGCARATSYSWNAQSGDWFTASNWNPNGVPGAADDVTISNDGTCTLNANVTVATLALNDTIPNTKYSTLAGSGTLTVSGATVWSGGTLGGTGTTTCNGALSINTDTPKLLTRTLNVNLSAVWSGAGNIASDAGVLNIASAALFDIQNDATIQLADYAENVVVNNAGTFRKSAGSLETLLKYVFFNNTGVVEVLSGTLTLGGHGTHSGSFTSAGGTVNFASQHTLTAAASVSGDTVKFAGDVTHAGAYDVAHTIISGSTTTLTGPPANLGTLDLNGTLNLKTTGASNAVAINMKGGLIGNATLNVDGMINWNGGAMGGTGTTNANGGISITALAQLSRTLKNVGTTTCTAEFLVESGGTFQNYPGAIFDLQNDSSIDPGPISPGVIANSGTFRKSGGTGVSAVNVPLNNLHTVDVQTGTLALHAGGVSNGTFNFVGATLAFTGGVHQLTSGAYLGGDALTMSGGTVSYAGLYAVVGATTVSGATAIFSGNVSSVGNLTISSGSLDLSDPDGAVSATSLTQSGGILSGSSALTVDGATVWSGGSMTGSGATTALGGLSISGGANKGLTRGLTNAAGATWTGAGSFTVDPGGLFSNLVGATFDIQNDSSIAFASGSGGLISNAGTFKKTAGSGTTAVQVAVTTGGNMEAKSGTLAFSGRYTQNAGVTRLDGGAISSVQTIDLQGGALQGSGSLTATVNNTGGVVAPGLSAGQLNETGAYAQGAGASFNVEIGGLSAGAQYDRLAVSGAATLDGALNVALINGFEPNLGDTFTIMTYASRSGDFSSTSDLNFANGKAFQKTVSGTDVILSVVGAATYTATQTGTPTQTPTITQTPTQTNTATRTHTSLPTSTATNTGSPTSSSTVTVTRTPTSTPSSTTTPTPTSSATPTRTGTATRTATSSSTPSHTPTVTRTATSTPTRTSTGTSTVTPSASPACGDGGVDADEQCDDGGTNAGDGCNSVCRLDALGVKCKRGIGAQERMLAAKDFTLMQKCLDKVATGKLGCEASQCVLNPGTLPMPVPASSCSAAADCCPAFDHPDSHATTLARFAAAADKAARTVKASCSISDGPDGRTGSDDDIFIDPQTFGFPNTCISVLGKCGNISTDALATTGSDNDLLECGRCMAESAATQLGALQFPVGGVSNAEIRCERAFGLLWRKLMVQELTQRQKCLDKVANNKLGCQANKCVVDPLSPGALTVLSSSCSVSSDCCPAFDHTDVFFSSTGAKLTFYDNRIADLIRRRCSVDRGSDGVKGTDDDDYIDPQGLGYGLACPEIFGSCSEIATTSMVSGGVANDVLECLQCASRGVAAAMTYFPAPPLTP